MSINNDLDALERLAKFPKGVSADPTSNMSPEDAEKWRRMNEEHGGKFKQAKALSCAMKDCGQPVTMIDNSGFPYCTEHGQRRKSIKPTRKLTKAEIKKLESGGQISYRKKAMEELAALDLDLTEASIPEVSLERSLQAAEAVAQAASVEKAASQQVAQIILDQMGGKRRLVMMIGAKNFIAHNNPPGVSFKFMSSGKPSKTGNHIKITLDEGRDTYDIEFSYIRGYNFRTVKKMTDIYADALQGIFRRQTGLALRLAAEQEARFAAVLSAPKRRGGFVVATKDLHMDLLGQGMVDIPKGSVGRVTRAEKSYGGPNVALLDQLGPGYDSETMDSSPGMKYEIHFPEVHPYFFETPGVTVRAYTWTFTSGDLRKGKRASEEGDEKEGKFEEGESADPTENMSEEDAKKWRLENLKNKDKFKGKKAKGPSEIHRVRDMESLVGPLVMEEMGDENVYFYDGDGNRYFFKLDNFSGREVRALNKYLTEDKALLRELRRKRADFEPGSHTPDGWEPGGAQPGSAVEDDEGEGSEIPDGEGSREKRAYRERLQWSNLTVPHLPMKAEAPDGSGEVYTISEYAGFKWGWTRMRPGASSGIAGKKSKNLTLVIKDAEDHAFGTGRWKNRMAASVQVGPDGMFRHRWPFTYAHGKAEEMLGHDVVSFSIPPTEGRHDAILFADGAKLRATVFHWNAGGMPAGLVVAKFDRKALAEAEQAMAGKSFRYASGPPGLTREEEGHWHQVMLIAENDGRAYAANDAAKAVEQAWKEYQRIVGRDMRAFFRANKAKMISRLQAQWINSRMAKEAREYAGQYGFTKKVQADCESCVRKAQKEATRIAKRAYGKNPKVAEFLSRHAARTDSLPAHILVAALSEMGPKVGAEKTARLEELRAQRGFKTASTPAGLIRDRVSKLASGEKVALADIAANSDTHFSDWMKAAESMAVEGLIRWDGVHVASLDARKAAASIQGIFKKFPAKFRRKNKDGKHEVHWMGSSWTVLEDLPKADLDKMWKALSWDMDQDTQWEPSRRRLFASGAANARYLDSLPAMAKAKILKGIARHYGISEREMYEELVDPDAEMLYEYITDGSRMQVYRDMSRMRLASDKEARSYGLYGFSDKVASLGLQACADMWAAAGRIAYDLHSRRASKHASITAFLDQHCKTAECKYSRLLAASYPEMSKTAGKKFNTKLEALEAAVADLTKQVKEQERKIKDLSDIASPLGSKAVDIWLKKDKQFLADRKSLLEEVKQELADEKKKSGKKASAEPPRTVRAWLEWDESEVLGRTANSISGE